MNSPLKYSDLRIIQKVEKIIKSYNGCKVSEDFVHEILREFYPDGRPIRGTDKGIIPVVTQVGNISIHNNTGIIGFSQDEQFTENARIIKDVDDFVEDFLLHHDPVVGK